MKKMSPEIAPKSKANAERSPLVILVSIRMKNTGPIVKANIMPKEIATKIFSIIFEIKSKYT